MEKVKDELSIQDWGIRLVEVLNNLELNLTLILVKAPLKIFSLVSREMKKGSH